MPEEGVAQRSRNADALRQQLDSIKKRQLALKAQLPPSGRVENVTLPKSSEIEPEDRRPKNRMDASLRSSSASALSKKSTQKFQFSGGIQSQPPSTALRSSSASALSKKSTQKFQFSGGMQSQPLSTTSSSVGLRLSQPRPTKSRLRSSQEWVPAGALFQAPPSVSWHRSSLRPQSAKHFRSSTPTSEIDRSNDQTVTRSGSPSLNRRGDPRDQSSVSWRVEGGDVRLHDGMGKMTLVGPALARHKALLGGGHLVRFLFRAPPPSSELGATVSLSSGHEGWRLFRRLAFHISSGGAVSLLATVGPASRKDAERTVQLGAINVGEWHVCQMVVGSTGGSKAHLDVWRVPGRTDPSDVPQVGRGLHGCVRRYWHHFVLEEDDEIGEEGGLAQQASQQTRDWDLAVETTSGGFEVGAWRVIPMQRAALSGGLPAAATPLPHSQSSASSAGGRGSRASLRREGGSSVEEAASGGGAGAARSALGDDAGGVEGELDANAIAGTWDVAKVQRFVEAFRDEFGEALTRHYAELFQVNEIDGAALLALTAADLETMGVRESGHRALLLKEIEGHLLACGSRALAHRPPAPPDHGLGVEDGHPPPSRAMEDPVRALLESLRNDLGDDRMREYHVLLSAAGVASVQDVVALSDARLLAAGVRALSHRKLLLARAETLKLLAVPGVYDRAEAAGSAAFGAVDARGRADIHPVVPHGFETKAGPGLMTVERKSEEFREVEQLLGRWAGEEDGTTLGVQGVHRVVLSSRMLERFKRRKAALRNPFAPILRLLHAGTGTQALAEACTHGLALPYKAGEFGKGVDFVGAVRPASRAPWVFPPGTHQVLVCDVAVGISWRMPDDVSRVGGEWDEDAAGIGYDYLHEWAVSSVGCEELGGKGWFKLKGGGFAECRQEVRWGDTVCCSFRFKEPLLAAEAVAGRGGSSLWACWYLQRGVYGSESYARFGFAITSGGEVVLVHEGAVDGREGGGAGGRKKEGRQQRGARARVAQLEERVWYSCEIRIGGAREGVVGLELLEGRSDGTAEDLGGTRGGQRRLCSHQSALRGGGEAGAGGWTAAVQLEGAGEAEVDDWLARHRIERGAELGEGGESEGGGGSVGLDGVRRAGYDSVYVPRVVESLDAAKLKLEEEVRSKPGKALEVVKAAQKQKAAETLGVGGASYQGSGKKDRPAEGQGKEAEGGRVCKAPGHRKGGARMGCKCDECRLKLEEDGDKVELWKRGGGSAKGAGGAEETLVASPFAVEHFDQYVVYNADQALPRYVISFTVKEKPPPPPPEVPPCWLCSDPPYKVQESHTTVELHMTGQRVPVCFSCAGRSRVPDAPLFVATADDGDPAATLSRGVATAWTQPFAPAPIDMYLLQHALMEEGADDLPRDGAFREIYSGAELRFVAAKLGPGQHCFRVRAKSMAGWGPWSEVLCRRVRRAVPGKGARGDGDGGDGGGGGRLLCDSDPWWNRKATAPVVFAAAPHQADIDPPIPGPEEPGHGGGVGGKGLGGWEGPVGTIAAARRVQYCAAWHPLAEQLWVKEDAAGLEVQVLDRRGGLVRAERLPVPATCMSFGPDGSLFVGSGRSFFSRLSPELAEVWRAEHSDGPCARGIAVDGAVVYAAFNSGPVLELDAATGAKRRALHPQPAFNMALSLVVVKPGIFAVSDSGRVLLFEAASGKLLGCVASGYLNAAIAWDGRKLLVANANSQVWHMFRPTHR